MRYVIRIVRQPIIDEAGHIAEQMTGNPTRFLQEFDPDANKGRGRIKTTTDVTQAMTFESFAAVMECWQTQSKVRPLRPDGKPNRPLTAFTVSPANLDEIRKPQ